MKIQTTLLVSLLAFNASAGDVFEKPFQLKSGGDVNGDGKLDILIGDSTRLVSPSEGLTEEEFPKAYGEWQAEYQKLVDQFNDRNLDKKENAPSTKK